jgi:hypothetical protein
LVTAALAAKHERCTESDRKRAVAKTPPRQPAWCATNESRAAAANNISSTASVALCVATATCDQGNEGRLVRVR